MKLSDLTFVAQDCCGVHEAATVARADGVDVGIAKAEGGLFNVTLYQNGGLLRREIGVDADRVEALLG